MEEFFRNLNYSQILQNIAIIIASITAVYGITSWRREAKWKRKSELAEEVLSGFYECHEAMKRIRFPGGSTEEGKTRKRPENETKEESDLRDMAYVAFERYQKEEASFTKLKTIKFRFMAVFGKKHSISFDEVVILKNEVLLAASRLGYDYWPKLGKSLNQAKHEKLLDNMLDAEKIMWSSSDGTDIIADRMDGIIQDIEKVCVPYLSKAK